MKLRLYACLIYSPAFRRQRQEDGKLASLTREILTQENKQTNKHTKNERKKSRTRNSGVDMHQKINYAVL